MNPIIGVTMGDPAGIGPEVIVKALADTATTRPYHPLVIGNAEILRQTAKNLGISLRIDPFPQFNDIDFSKTSIPVLDWWISPLEISAGKTDRLCGEHSFQYVVETVKLCQQGNLDAMVTAPICKNSWHLANHRFDGHTGLLAQLTKTDNYRMMFATDRFHVVLVTTHLPLSKVSSVLNVSSVLQTIELGYQQLKALGFDKPKLAVCGLNPHAGENGLFGREDLEIIHPAIQQARQSGIDVSGPYPADTIFLHALKGEFDLVVAQYHDQGLIPVKLLSFDDAVNITIRLPIIRTSVDHGTAFDIAGKGVANHTNMTCAINYAVKLSMCRMLLS